MPAQGLLIALGGPTASGKTDLAIALARHFNTHILSADSRQFYLELSIGSAAPDAEHLKAAPHHFIADRSVEEPISAAGFAREARALLKTLFKIHPVVITVGGSGMYLKALTDGLSDLPEPDPELRQHFSDELKQSGLPHMVSRLLNLDANATQFVALDNPRRVTRALELVTQTGLPLSKLFAPPPAPPFKVMKLALNLPRSLLYERINQRVDAMIEQGLQAEAEALYPLKHLPSLQTVGYREVFDYMDGKLTWPQAIDKIKQNTRNFAKRQLTWFGNPKEGYAWVTSVDDAVARVPTI